MAILWFPKIESWRISRSSSIRPISSSAVKERSIYASFTDMILALSEHMEVLMGVDSKISLIAATRGTFLRFGILECFRPYVRSK